jgi:hypothetical protein
MPEAKLPAIVGVVGSERGRSEDWVSTQRPQRELRRVVELFMWIGCGDDGGVRRKREVSI